MRTTLTTHTGHGEQRAATYNNGNDFCIIYSMIITKKETVSEWATLWGAQLMLLFIAIRMFFGDSSPSPSHRESARGECVFAYSLDLIWPLPAKVIMSFFVSSCTFSTRVPRVAPDCFSPHEPPLKWPGSGSFISTSIIFHALRRRRRCCRRRRCPVIWFMFIVLSQLFAVCQELKHTLRHNQKR